MNAWLSVMILAVVQGLTEFLPVSSSGHLILGKHLLGLQSPGLRLEIILHAGTLLALCVYFWRRLWTLATGALKGEAAAWRMIAWLVLASLPAVLMYKFALKHHMAAIESPVFAACGLLFTGLLLLTLMRSKESAGGMTWGRALLMGIAQAVAILPGVSRSGSTVAAGRHAGVVRSEAGEFAMLMSLPIILGSLILDMMSGELGSNGDVTTAMYAVGAAVAAVVGYAAVAVFMRILKSDYFWMFGVYCLILGFTALAFLR